MDFHRRFHEWEMTARIMATVTNSQKTRNPVKPRDLNPMVKVKRLRESVGENLEEESPLLRWL